MIEPSIVDLQGLGQLRHDQPGALEQAAQQFESLIIGMMLKTARDAQLAEGLFDNSQSRQYLELMDQQVALELAQTGGFGFSEMIMDQLGATQPEAQSFQAATPADFMRELLPEARRVADTLGLDPKLLLAQAALETGWGQSLPRHADGRSSNNLFGVKAGPGWRGASVMQWTLENIDGVMTKQRDRFRAYASTAASFADYADLMTQSARYRPALTVSGDAEAYARQVASQGYATDPDYADKWLSIYRGALMNDTFKSAQVNHTAADTHTTDH